MDAISLRPLLTGETDTHREHVRCGLDDWRMVFDGRYKLVVRNGEPPILYDIEGDPLEDANVAEQHPGGARLEAILVGAERSDEAVRVLHSSHRP